MPAPLVAKPLRSFFLGTQPKLTFLIRGEQVVDFTGETTTQGIADFAMSACAMSKDQKRQLAAVVMDDIQRQQ